MNPQEKTKLYRLLDANFNRAKEGLRVCEDICRFIHDNVAATSEYKKLRHELNQIVISLKIEDLLASRNVENDVGRRSIPSERLRKDTGDIFYANSQRVKESIRVLEEFSKMFDAPLAEKIKKMRYRIYALEKKIVTRS